MQHIRLFLFALILLATPFSHAGERIKKPNHISEKVWKEVKPYLIPEDHPAKKTLDKIFSQSRVILSLKSLEKAGFSKPKVRKFTRLIVVKHSELPGYVFKIYLDAQRYYRKTPEHEHWIKRVQGAQMIQDLLDKKGWNKSFKVPKKWIYTLPEKPSPPKEFLRKDFIIIEEDMNLLDLEGNKKAWRSEKVTARLLTKVHAIIEEIGLCDCAKIDNIPFSTDGRISFIDTQSFHIWPVNYSPLLSNLRKEMRPVWEEIVLKNGGK